MLVNRVFSIHLVLLAALAAWCCSPAWAADTAAEVAKVQQDLIAVLQGDAPSADKAIACKRLALCGNKDAVPALAALLADEQLAAWARIALEAIPDPAADEALRDAMDKFKGRTLIGVINSLGVRRDAHAVDRLASRLADADSEVASAAAVALGKIGNEAAVKHLDAKLADVPPAIRSAVAEGCIRGAEQLAAEGKTAEAVALYEKVRSADVPKQRIVEATRGLILARGSAGIPLLIEQLRSDDKTMYRLGLTVARELPGAEVSEVLANELTKTPADRQAMFLLALGDRADTSVLPAVRQAAKTGSKDARVAAVSVLARLGDVSCVPELLDVATEDDAELVEAAKAVLAQLPGEQVDADLVGRLAGAEGKKRLVLVELAGQRRIAAATPTLLKAADDSDPAVRRAAIAALGSTVGQDNLAALVVRVASPGDPEDAAVAQKALLTAATRMPDREAAAAQLAAAIAGAPVAAQCALLEVLGAMGGPTSLEALGAATRRNDASVKDTASRLLGQWMTLDAAPVLLDLAKTLPETKYKVRALRGYIRLVRQFPVADAQRAAMCAEAMAAAERVEEKKLVLEVMERYPSLDMLKLAAAAAADPALKEDAGVVAMAVAQRIDAPADQRHKLLTEAGQPPVKLEIVKAEYGVGDKVKDVTAVLQKLARDLPLIVLPKSTYDTSLGGDPAPGAVKQLKVQYRIDGKPGETTLPQDARVLLPMPK